MHDKRLTTVNKEDEEEEQKKRYTRWKIFIEEEGVHLL
jgi:hypothetical protein